MLCTLARGPIASVTRPPRSCASWRASVSQHTLKKVFEIALRREEKRRAGSVRSGSGRVPSSLACAASARLIRASPPKALPGCFPNAEVCACASASSLSFALRCAPVLFSSPSPLRLSSGALGVGGGSESATHGHSYCSAALESAFARRIGAAPRWRIGDPRSRSRSG